MSALPTQCAEPGCAYKALEGARCPVHTRSRWPASGRAYRGAWPKVRNEYIRTNPVCEWPGCSAGADEVDHVVRVKVDPNRRLDPTNLRSLCLHHHRRMTARASNTKTGAEGRRS